MENHKKRVNLVGPTILILLGIVLLSNNLGWTAISAWDLLRLWPILLIAGGLELLVGRRSALGSVLVLVAMLVMLAGGLWLLTSANPTEPAKGQVIGEALGEAKSAQVDIGFGVGTLLVGSMPESSKLIEGTAELHRGEQLEREFRLADDTAYVALRSRGNWSVPLFGWDGDKTWDLRLNRDVPTRLKISTGVGDVAADLRRMNLTGLELDTGVGRATVTLPERGDFEAKIDAGVGELVIKVPQGMEVAVFSSTGLGHVSVPSSYHRRGEGYVSSGYDGAQHRVDLTLEVGIGRIVIQEYVGG
jgi:hypothetical protein